MCILKKMNKLLFNFSHSESGDIEGIAYTGDVLTIDNGEKVIFDLSSVAFKDKMPFLLNHKVSDIVGHGTIAIDNNQIKIFGKTAKTEKGLEVAELSRDGFPWQLSVYIDPKKVIRVKRGEKYSVNGKTVMGPIAIYKDSTIKEVSFTPMGIDSNTTAKVFSIDNDNKEIKMSTISKIEEVKKLFSELEEADQKAFACGCASKFKVEDLLSDEEKKANEEKEKEFKSYKKLYEDKTKEIEDLKAELEKEKKRYNQVEKFSALKNKFSTLSDEEINKLVDLDDSVIEIVAKSFSVKTPSSSAMKASDSGIQKAFSQDEITLRAKKLVTETGMSFAEAVKRVSGIK